MFFGRKKRDTALRSLVDELGDVREKLRLLRLREQELREEILVHRPNAYVLGDQYELEYRTIKKRHFQKNALPQHVREDPVFWRTETVQTLKLIPLENARRFSARDVLNDAYGDTRALDTLPSPPEERATLEAVASLPDATTPTGSIDPLTQAAEPSVAFDRSSAPMHATKT